ncbi:MAG: SDR family NAD(P)-dependent oxidoreductase, partial [Flavobacteriaceae bacterium]|nr:SDR family NAD(P)-dependent oxidoreductase [Flavobacteriaceae bacterium]
MKILEGKTAIITGASRGIGKGIAQVFAAHGCNVAFTFSSSEGPAKEL